MHDYDKYQQCYKNVSDDQTFRLYNNDGDQLIMCLPQCETEERSNKQARQSHQIAEFIYNKVG